MAMSRALLLLVSSLAAAAVSGGAGKAAAQDLAGAWVLDAAASDDVNAAIDRATSRMSFITRPVARSRLRGATRPARTLLVQRTADAKLMTVEGEAPIRMPADGSPVRWRRSDGETVEVSGRWRERTFVQSFSADDGRRTNEYVLRDDGGLDLRVVIASERLPAPVEYRLVYRRTGNDGR